MLRFDWSAFVTEDLLADVARVVGSPAADAAWRPLIARILEEEGGVPFVDAEIADPDRTRAARRLVHGAVRSALAAAGLTRTSPAHALRPPTHPRFEQEAVAAPPVAVNAAAASAFERLPGIGRDLADRIAGERRHRGEFRDAADLATRVVGVGRTILERVKPALSFTPAATAFGRLAPHDADFAADLRRLLDLVGNGSPSTRIIAALDFVLVESRARPRPRGCRPTADVQMPPPDPAFVACDAITLLAGGDYFRVLPDLIGSATASVDVCMFHAAPPTANHPTRKLLDALIAAKDRGAAVRVLLDVDRPTDPYGSSIINTPAKMLLESRGVPVRFDARERLLHSKFLVLDAKTVVIGSHNWSAGSFFQLDDVSVVIDSVGVAADFAARFASLWGA